MELGLYALSSITSCMTLGKSPSLGFLICLICNMGINNITYPHRDVVGTKLYPPQKALAQCLVHWKCSINVSCYYYYSHHRLHLRFGEGSTAWNDSVTSTPLKNTLPTFPNQVKTTLQRRNMCEAQPPELSFPQFIDSAKDSFLELSETKLPFFIHGSAKPHWERGT